MNGEEEQVGMILVSQNTWDKVKTKFPPPIESIFPTMGLMKDIPIRISNLASDGEIIQVPKKMTDAFKGDMHFPPEFKVRIEPLWLQLLPLT